MDWFEYYSEWGFGMSLICSVWALILKNKFSISICGLTFIAMAIFLFVGPTGKNISIPIYTIAGFLTFLWIVMDRRIALIWRLLLMAVGLVPVFTLIFISNHWPYGSDLTLLCGIFFLLTLLFIVLSLIQRKSFIWTLLPVLVVHAGFCAYWAFDFWAYNLLRYQ